VQLPFPSGAAVHVAEVAESLQRIGHEVHVIARRSSRAEPKVQDFKGVKIHRINRFIVRTGGRKAPSSSRGERSRGLAEILYNFYLRTAFMIYASFAARQVVSRNSLDAIIERETAFGAGGLASVLTGKPLILEVIGPRYSRLSVRQSSSILYYTESMLRDWVDRRKCVKVTAGVNLDVFKPDSEAGNRVKSRLHLGEFPVVGYVGSFQKWHGVDTLLQAASLLKDKGTKISLLMVGPSFEPYVSLTDELGLSDSCTFVGPVDYGEVAAYINACDLLVAPYNPSKDELRKDYGIGSPIKVLEYMACGKPVISTSVPPIDSMTKDDGPMMLVSPGDPASLADALERLVQDPQRATKMAGNGLKLVSEGFSWQSFSQTLSLKIEEA